MLRGVKTHEGSNGMDFKSLFKRKAAADTLPSKAVDKPKKPEKARKIRTLSKRTQWGVLVVVLLLLCSGVAFYLFFWPDFAKDYADVLPSFMTEEEAKAPPAPPPPKLVPHQAATSGVAPASGVVKVSAVSSVNPTSGVSSQVAATRSSVASSTSSVVASSSAVTSATVSAPPMEAIPAISHVADAPPAPRKVVTRPKNLDMRHCLDLKTEAEIMRCVYPKR